MISRKERRQAAEYSAEQAMAMKQGPEGHLIAGAVLSVVTAFVLTAGHAQPLKTARGLISD